MPKRSNVTPLSRAQPSSVYRSDGWMNVMTGLNVAGRDKRRAADFFIKRISEFQAEDLWRGDAIIARAIETVPRVMMRNGFDVVIGDESVAEKPGPPKPPEDTGSYAGRTDGVDPIDAKKLMAKKLAELKTVSHFIEAQDMARAFGGSALLIGTDDLNAKWNDLSRFERPLDFRRIRDVRWLTALRPHECWPRRWYRDPLSPQYGTPSVYNIQRDAMGGTGGHAPFLCHESRLIRFYGVTTSKRQMGQNNGWGDSIIMRFMESVADFQAAHQGAAQLIADFAQAVHKMEGLAELVATGQDKQLARRSELIQLSRSISRSVLIDSKEEFERKTTPVSGLPELLDRAAQKVASEIDMPVTLLMGQAPAGLNATGDSDIRWFYDHVANQRENTLRHRLDYLLRCLFLSVEGPTDGQEPASWRVQFHPLWQPTAKEQAETRKLVAEADDLYIASQTVTPEEVATSRWGGDEFGTEITLDDKLRAKVAAAREESDEVAAVPFNGIQVEAAQGIMTAVAAGQLPKETGAKMLAQFFGFTPEVAEDLVVDIDEGAIKDLVAGMQAGAMGNPAKAKPIAPPKPPKAAPPKP